MNAKISVFAICVEAIIHLLFYNLHDFTFKNAYFEEHLQTTASNQNRSRVMNIFFLENLSFWATVFLKYSRYLPWKNINKLYKTNISFCQTLVMPKIGHYLTANIKKASHKHF